MPRHCNLWNLCRRGILLWGSHLKKQANKQQQQELTGQGSKKSHEWESDGLPVMRGSRKLGNAVGGHTVVHPRSLACSSRGLFCGPGQGGLTTLCQDIPVVLSCALPNFLMRGVRCAAGAEFIHHCRFFWLAHRVKTRSNGWKLKLGKHRLEIHF